MASTINIDDLHFAEGTMFGGLPVSPMPGEKKPYIPGTDVAGIVDCIGPDVKTDKRTSDNSFIFLPFRTQSLIYSYDYAAYWH